jgi:hypothetical protein
MTLLVTVKKHLFNVTFIKFLSIVIVSVTQDMGTKWQNNQPPNQKSRVQI